MNCSPTICIALLLLSLSAGMWLLYKTQKENLGTFFKVVAWFVIVVSFCSMICCAMCCAMRCCMMRNECREMERCEMGMGEGMNKCADDNACEMKKGCCKKGKGECEEGKEAKMGCCKKEGDKCEEKIEIDTVITKK